jgi:hypothetical protein
MPANPGARATVNLGEDLIRAARRRADEEGREFSELVSRAVRAYLDAPAIRVADALPGLVPDKAEAGLRDEVRQLTAEVRKLLPQATAAAEGHAEIMDTLDQLTTELGRRNGAALALEQIQKQGS